MTYRRHGISFVLVLLFLAGWGTLRWVPPPECPEALPVQGWIDDPDAVAEIRAGLAQPDFVATEAFHAPYTGPDDVYLWNACREVTGEVLPPRNQLHVGACVGFGTASAIEHLICVQVAAGAEEEFQPLAPEVIYAGSRVQIGGGRIRGDGSVGAWAARFVTEYGVAARGQYGTYNLLLYDPTLCRHLGQIGVPEPILRVARQTPVRSVANVRTWEECQAAIRHGYPIAVCSSQGFTFERDHQGFCQPRGTWMHCMAIVGIRGAPRPGAFLLNSWGPGVHRGPLGPGNPSPAGFWADASVIDRMLRQGDSWAFSRFAGFPARPLDWYAGADSGSLRVVRSHSHFTWSSP